MQLRSRIAWVLLIVGAIGLIVSAVVNKHVDTGIWGGGLLLLAGALYLYRLRSVGGD